MGKDILWREQEEWKGGMGENQSPWKHTATPEHSRCQSRGSGNGMLCLLGSAS